MCKQASQKLSKASALQGVRVPEFDWYLRVPKVAFKGFLTLLDLSIYIVKSLVEQLVPI